MEERNENHGEVERSQLDLERCRKACQNRKVRIYGGVDTAANGPPGGPHASLEDSGVMSARERTVANGITVSGAGIGES